MTSSLIKIASAAEVPELKEHHLPLPHWLYGVIAFVVFMALLGLLWSFRNTANSSGSAPDGKTEH